MDSSFLRVKTAIVTFFEMISVDNANL